ncbi:hypothetical protein LY78DRAFT_182257 [Colletotrichum sublineola]|nr:hypothetical protein LY78DRAFT_182257 [Colletotrichum sublineola]
MDMFGRGDGGGGVGFPKIEQGGKLMAPTPTHTNRRCTQWAGTQGNEVAPSYTVPSVSLSPPLFFSPALSLTLLSLSSVVLFCLACTVRHCLFVPFFSVPPLCLITEEHGQGMTVWTRLSPFLPSLHERVLFVVQPT